MNDLVKPPMTGIVTPYLEYKTERVRQEWLQGYGYDPDLKSRVAIHPAIYVIVLAAAHWFYRRTGKPATMTELFRWRQEQRAYYPKEPGKLSVHQLGKGGDLRTKIEGLRWPVKREWESWINGAFPYLSKSAVKTAKVHHIDNGAEHLHLQAGSLEPTPAPIS